VRLVRTISDARARRSEQRTAARSVAFVPTMGYLHEGHLSLVRRARQLGDTVWVSIFVNPTQFGPDEDLDRYPRDLERDLSLLEQEGVTTVFVPSNAEMYPDEPVVGIGFSGLERLLCGEDRPTHFAGVGLVVGKLFNIVEPDVAVFGQKDYQQSLLIRRLAADLNFPVAIEVSPTVREPDGLAMSSRNAMLSDEEREAAPAIYRALCAGRNAVLAGERDSTTICRIIHDVIAAEPVLTPQYVHCVDAHNLAENPTISGEVVLAVAARAGTTRLIDNILVSPS